MLGATLLANLLKTAGSAASSLICLSSSSLISSSSKVSSTGIVLLASMAISKRVEIAPVCKGTGTSFKTPKILTLLPGVVLDSILGSTKSSCKKTLILLGCSPPSKESGDSSIESLCASIISLLNNLKFPFHPQEHLEGSLNFLSICRTDKIAPQLGHSNLALTTCGLTSDACLTIPSIQTMLSKCFALISLIAIKALLGKSSRLTLALLTSPDSSKASSKRASVSSGESITFSDKTGEKEAKFGKLR